jgi:hypothetical protein
MTEADAWDDDFNRLMDATQTLIQLQPGVVLTQEMIDDLHLVDKDHRESFERATDAFHNGYEAGIARVAGADTAKLIEERDDARMRVQIANAVSTAGKQFAFIRGAQVCREMMARFVEQGGEPLIAQSIRLNWRPSWGDDPGAPDETDYASASPCEIDASCDTHPKDGDSTEIEAPLVSGAVPSEASADAPPPPGGLNA